MAVAASPRFQHSSSCMHSTSSMMCNISARGSSSSSHTARTVHSRGEANPGGRLFNVFVASLDRASCPCRPSSCFLACWFAIWKPASDFGNFIQHLVDEVLFSTTIKLSIFCCWWCPSRPPRSSSPVIRCVPVKDPTLQESGLMTSLVHICRFLERHGVTCIAPIH